MMTRCIPGLVAEAFTVGSRHQTSTPILTKNEVDESTGICNFTWDAPGSLGIYRVEACGKIDWQLDPRKRYVARGLTVTCTCPDGERQAVKSSSINTVVVCKHGAAALESVLDPLAKFPGAALAKADVDAEYEGEPMIDGAPVKKHIFKGKHGNGCEECGFHNWSAGDVKYIVEQWMNEDSSHGAREHLCPPCAVTRGLPYTYFYQNKNAPLVDVEDLISKVQDTDEEDESECQSCGLSVCSIGDFTVEGIVIVHDNNTGQEYSLCMKCAAARVHYEPIVCKERNGHPIMLHSAKRSEPSSSNKNIDEQTKSTKMHKVI